MNCSTEKPIATVQAATNLEVDTAVKAAKAALQHDSWKLLTVSDWGALLSRLADLIADNTQLFATIDAWDNGKPFREALEVDLVEAIATIRYYAGWADKISGRTISTTHNKFAYTIRQPIGVVAQIIPWNYPLSMATWKLGPALTCGNTVVLKAAEQTPLSILVLAKLVRDVGFPPGVVNLLNGYGRDTGVAMVSHPLVDKIDFTGGTATARLIMGLAAKSLKNITLETGGKLPLLVFDDTDLEQAVKWSHLGIMSNQGQICTATSRIIVQEGIYDKFVERFLTTIKEVSKVGSQWNEDTYQGPQVSKIQYERILELIEYGKEQGATLAAGGTPHKIDDTSKGFYIIPTVFTGTLTTSRIWREEIFGREFQDGVFMTNLERAYRVASQIEAGMVWVNSSQDCDPRVPFGGVKQSGIGRELGEAGLEVYTQIKAVYINMSSKL